MCGEDSASEAAAAAARRAWVPAPVRLHARRSRGPGLGTGLLQLLAPPARAHLVSALNELDGHQLPSLLVAAELHEAECAAVQVPDLRGRASRRSAGRARLECASPCGRSCGACLLIARMALQRLRLGSPLHPATAYAHSRPTAAPRARHGVVRGDTPGVLRLTIGAALGCAVLWDGGHAVAGTSAGDGSWKAWDPKRARPLLRLQSSKRAGCAAATIVAAAH